jgi:hypothetical protein
MGMRPEVSFSRLPMRFAKPNRIKRTRGDIERNGSRSETTADRIPPERNISRPL